MKPWKGRTKTPPCVAVGLYSHQHVSEAHNVSDRSGKHARHQAFNGSGLIY
jgi:hypothetical protein